MILRCLTDGMSLRATCRATGVSMGTVLRLLEEAGTFCAFYHCQIVRNLPTVRVEADEQWSYVGAKQKRAKLSGHGDLWTYAALDTDSKLVISYLVGARNAENTYTFIADLAKRVSERIQLSTDAYQAYWGAVRAGFGFARCDFAQAAASGFSGSILNRTFNATGSIALPCSYVNPTRTVASTITLTLNATR